ncbi:MAG: exosortase/archaeosortase family protein [Pirellulales bacterium]|nr:exosortase/archaeosortase family protein [Pirellulales bacterium]
MRWIAAAAILTGAVAWSYWPTLLRLVHTWDREPDYSHGFFVIPLAVFFLWARRDRFPGSATGFAWPGLIVIALSVGVRILGARWYVDAVDGWSMMLLIGGIVWLLAGYRVFLWSLPSVAFLWFMVPLPWRMERWVSLPLQRVATQLSCWTLQCFGQPALAEGNTILIDDLHFEVEQACSGLRIFVAIFALAFAYVILVRRTWWEKLFLLASAIPIALIANSARIVVTTLLGLHVSGEAAHRFTHDFAGWVMIPFAAGLFAMVLWYLGKATREIEQVDIGTVVQQEHV